MKSIFFFYFQKFPRAPEIQTTISTLGAPTLPSKGGPLKGLQRPAPARPLPTKGLAPVEQKIEQQVVQQEEEMPIVQQKVEQKVEQFPISQEPLRPQPAKVGIIRWEQHIETAPKKSYKPRKSLLKPQVQQIEQQVCFRNGVGLK